MKIISWNVNGLRANIKKGGFDFLMNESPDIFCLQETKARPEQLDEGVLKPDGYTSYFDYPKLKKGYSGVAIYTKQKPEKVVYEMGDLDLDNEGRLIGVYFKDFVLFNVYFPNGGGGPERLAYKMRFYDKFLKHIEKVRKTENKNIIFTGDVNTAHNEIDLARPKENEKSTGFLPEERAWLDKIVSLGYIDTFRHFHPDRKDAYSWWDMKTFARERNVGWRIDYFFVSKEMMKKIKKAEILSDVYGSDHCPISLEF